jgi:hypothetical protein
MYYCSDNKKRPQDNQHFTLRFYRDIATASLENCLDAYTPGDKKELKMGGCHNGQGNQYFRYDLETKHIYHGPIRNKNCIETDIKTQTVYVTKCDLSKLSQKWQWGFVNETNVKNWLGYGSKIIDQQEIRDLKSML